MRRCSVFGLQPALCNDCSAVIVGSFEAVIALHGGEAVCRYCGGDQVCACDWCVEGALDHIAEDIAA
jgi:hypothetical protein